MPEGVAVAADPPPGAREAATADPIRLTRGAGVATTTLELSSLQDLAALTTAGMEICAPTDVQSTAVVEPMMSAIGPRVIGSG